MGEMDGDTTIMLYTHSEGTGALNLGGCMILGKPDKLNLRTLYEEYNEQYALDAVWKDIYYKNEDGLTRKETVLVARSEE